MSRNRWIALAAASLSLAAVSTQASAADHRWGGDLDVAVTLIGDNFSAFVGSDGYYARPYNYYRPDYGRYHRWNRGHRLRTDVVVTRAGYLKRVYYRRGRVVDAEIIGRVDRRGNWRYFERGYDDHPRYHRRGDYRDHRYDGRRRYYERRSRHGDDRYYDRRRDWRDDRYEDRHDRRDDRHDDRRDRRDDRNDDRRDRRDDRRDDRQDDRRDRRDDGRNRDYRRDSRYDGSWRGDETSVVTGRVMYETDDDGLIIRPTKTVVGRVARDN